MMNMYGWFLELCLETVPLCVCFTGYVTAGCPCSRTFSFFCEYPLFNSAIPSLALEEWGLYILVNWIGISNPQ